MPDVREVFMLQAVLTPHLPKQFVDHPAFHDADLRQQILESMPDPEGESPAHAKPALKSPLYNEEQLLFLRMNCLKFLATQRRLKAISSGQPELDNRAATALDRSAQAIRNDIAVKHMRLPHYVARALTQKPDAIEELVSDGSVVLLRVIEHFDVRFGFKFQTYASAALARELRRKLYQAVRQQAKTHVTDTLDPIDTTEAAPLYCEDELRRTSEFLATLPEREREILKWRFGFYGNDKIVSYRQLSTRFNVSGERLRQIVERSCQKAHSFLRPAGGPPARAAS